MANPTKLGYQATQDKGRRQAPIQRTKHEDKELSGVTRQKMLATARDHVRNYAILGWMLRRHLDYVSRFTPMLQSTGSEALDAYLVREVARHGKRRNFDAAKRHSRDQFMRIFEALKFLDGDAAMLKLEGARFQGIESDRIAKPSDLPAKLVDIVTDHGLILDDMGATSQYCICKRQAASPSLLSFDQLTPADAVIFDGYFGRFDQTRGISPLAAIINQSTDLHEAMEFTQLKIKLGSLMGVQINRETQAAIPDGFATTEIEASDVDAAGAETDDNQYEFNTRGITVFDLEPGESVKEIESQTPSTEFANWTDKVIRFILLAADIPYSAFNGDAASFSARIADRDEYEKSADEKRNKNRDVLEEIYDFTVAEWARTRPEFRRLLREAGMTPEQAASHIEWVAAGTPWLDKLKEVNGAAISVYNGFESRQRVCRRHGSDYFKIIDELAEEQEYARAKGVVLAMGAPGQVTLEEAENNADTSEITDEDTPDE
jgi:capsid protein